MGLGNKIEDAKAQAQVFHTKEKGVYSEASRDIFRTLADGGISLERCREVMTTVLQTAGFTVQGPSGSRRTASRSIFEAGVMPDMQMGSELANADHLTLSGDGTTHRNIDYESRFVNMSVPSYDESNPTERKQSRSMGVDPAKDHTSKTQHDGYYSKLEGFIETCNESPLSARQQKALMIANIFSKLTGYSSDHAKDQKLVSQMLEQTKHNLFTEGLGNNALFDLSETQQQEQMEKVQAAKSRSLEGRENGKLCHLKRRTR